MSIDWSKAPEGSNKAGFTGHDQYLQFYRIPGMFGDYDYWNEKRGWSGNDFPTCANYLFDRPEKVEWNGQGLPPTGLLVEWKAGLDHEWRRVTVLAYANGDAWLQPEDGDSFIVGNPANFRRIRTPEQIAAEEREKAIEEMCFAVETLTVKQAKALFDAGYRRQESST
ncbi:hypothetical protein [Pseudomonas aeruginosa]|uniref:hypothetical protein n=1 Tax=Pseudomonas aeruginosa TaxID=287 RepID=UPI00157F8A07|nr:hypothetical protein [Pseudomonas aeruginosa]EKW7238644.1 hypothetical protein [Pseudomonas aeruginosa]MBI8834193.1 hypothetical protein [Pseudomonas aeruginosa]QKR11199.1 hypothetical protein HB744_22280 [Pseudomonas aeruginosa]